MGHNENTCSAVVTYSTADEASMALASSEAVLGCDDVQLRQLFADNAAATAVSRVSQVTCSQCLMLMLLLLHLSVR